MNYTTRLPAEILRYLFACTQHVDPVVNSEGMKKLRDCRDRERRLARALAWVSVTHNCSRWRSVAINDPSLWMEIPVALGLDWLGTFVMRSSSGAGPIMLDWKSVRAGRIDGIMLNWIYHALIPAYYPIMGNLDIKPHLDLPAELLSTLDCSWPVLKDLCLSYPPEHTIPDSILNHDFPRLRALTWNGAHSSAFPWQAPCLQHLTHLTLSFELGLQPAQVARLIDALNSTRHLKELRIMSETDGSWQVADDLGYCSACIPEMRTCNLNLDVMFWHADMNTLPHIMSHIVLPPTTRLWLEVYETTQLLTETMVASIRSICNRAHSRRQDLPDPLPYLTAQITEWDHCHIKIYLSRSPIFPPTQSSLPNRDRALEDPTIDFALDMIVSYNDAYLSIIRAVFEELSLHGIQALFIRGSNPSTLVSMLSDAVFRNVRCLRLPSSRAGEYLNSLIAPAEPVLLPDLTLLAFEDTICSSLADLAAGNLLRGFVSARREAGVGLRAVYIPEAKDTDESPKFDQSMLARIEEAVVESESSAMPMYAVFSQVGAFNMQQLQGVPVHSYAARMNEKRLKKAEDVVVALKTIPEVVFMSSAEGALYEQDLWRETIG